jgi:hypothetical protein
VRFAALVLALGLVACGSDDEPAQAPPSPGFGAVWAEFLQPSELEATFPLLESRALAVNVAWTAAADDPALLDLSASAASSGVTLRPWLLLPEADGYWPGATNAAPFSAKARALMDAWDARGLAPTALIVDMELKYDLAVQVTEHLAKDPPDLAAVVALMKSNVDPSRFGAATTEFASLADEAHQRGWQVHLTTLPNVLDDYADGDDDLRQALGIPVEGVAWDVMTFQAYRTLVGELVAGSGSAPPTAYVVYDYGRSARERFGEIAGLDLGLVGAGVTDSAVYAGPHELREDVEAAHAAGVPAAQINVYNLDGMLERAPAESWLEPPAENPSPPAEDPASLEVRESSALLDLALD